MVLSEPLHGGSPEEWVTKLMELQEGSKESSVPGVNRIKVPPHGFSEDHAGPADRSFVHLD
jgi:hypothetical protein